MITVYYSESKTNKMPSFINKVKIFAGSGSKSIANKIARAYGKGLGNVTLNNFSDGEFQPCIDEIIDKEGRDEIYEYFKSDDIGNIDAAVNEFDGEFTHEEMKIFQIQFMSDVAN